MLDRPRPDGPRWPFHSPWDRLVPGFLVNTRNVQIFGGSTPAIIIARTAISLTRLTPSSICESRHGAPGEPFDIRPIAEMHCTLLLRRLKFCSVEAEAGLQLHILTPNDVRSRHQHTPAFPIEPCCVLIARRLDSLGVHGRPGGERAAALSLHRCRVERSASAERKNKMNVGICS